MVVTLLRKLRPSGHLLAVAAGVVLVWLSLRELVAGSGDALDWIGLLLGAGLVLLFAGRFIRAWRRETGNFIVVTTDTGSVRLHASVVEEELRRTARSLPEVNDSTVRILMNQQTQVPEEGQVEARVRDLSNVVSIHDTLARVLRDRYQKIMPGAAPIDFHLTIRRHQKPGEPRGDDEEPDQDDETRSFRAPRYPVPH